MGSSFLYSCSIFVAYLIGSSYTFYTCRLASQWWHSFSVASRIGAYLVKLFPRHSYTYCRVASLGNLAAYCGHSCGIPWEMFCCGASASRWTLSANFYLGILISIGVEQCLFGHPSGISHWTSISSGILVAYLTFELFVTYLSGASLVGDFYL